jgi:VanZ family protein
VNALKSYYLPPAAWTAVLVVFALVSLPEAPQPPALNVDKVRHAAAYALLGALAARAMAGAARGGGTFAFVAAFFAVAAVGAGTEVIQLFAPGRSADVVDLGADLAGGGCGALAYLWAFTGRPAPPEDEP